MSVFIRVSWEGDSQFVNEGKKCVAKKVEITNKEFEFSRFLPLEGEGEHVSQELSLRIDKIGDVYVRLHYQSGRKTTTKKLNFRWPEELKNGEKYCIKLHPVSGDIDVSIEKESPEKERIREITNKKNDPKTKEPDLRKDLLIKQLKKKIQDSD